MKFSSFLANAHQPFFLYDGELFTKRLTQFENSTGLRLFYAVKANPLGKILRAVKGAGMGVDVASLGEFYQALRHGFLPEEILVTGPAKSRAQLKEYLELGVNHFVIESFRQLKDLAFLSSAMGYRPKILLRLQLDWGNLDGNILGGSEITPFGQTPEEWRGFLLQYPSLLEYTEILGFHCFQWGNTLDIQFLQKIWRGALTNAQSLAKDLGIEFQVMDLGGGLGIPYQDHETQLAWDDCANILQELKKEFHLNEVWLELGRYATGPIGQYFAPIVDAKTVRGKRLLILDGGINHLARPALVSPFPCRVWGKEFSPMEKVRVHGPLCTSLDFLGEFTLPIDLHPGDWAVFSQVGAYGFTESMPFFLGHDLPAEVWRQGEEIEIVRPNQSSSEWMR